MRSLLENKRKILPVAVDNVTYHVRGWNLRERIEFSKMARDSKPETELAVHILRNSVCDESGNLTLTDCTDDDIANIDGITAQTIISAALNYNRLSAEQVDDAKKD